MTRRLMNKKEIKLIKYTEKLFNKMYKDFLDKEEYDDYDELECVYDEFRRKLKRHINEIYKEEKDVIIFDTDYEDREWCLMLFRDIAKQLNGKHIELSYSVDTENTLFIVFVCSKED